MNKRIYALVIGVAGLFAACSDWVDIRTKGDLIPEETVNYRYLMNNTENFRNTLSWQDVASDDIYVYDTAQQNAFYETDKFVPIYTWADEIYSQSEQDEELNDVYQVIYNCNVVIDEVMESNGGTDAEKQQIRAEALVHRAAAYLALADVYGKPYRAATAETDESVPLLTEPRVEGSLPRASVAEVYRQIVQDLNDAIEYLPDVADYTFYPGKCAAYALLARAYLVMGNYTEALTNAEAALELKNTLENLNDYADMNPVVYPDNLTDKEVILAKMPCNQFIPSMAYSSASGFLVLNEELLDLFDREHDLRYQLFTAPITDYTMTEYDTTFLEGRVYCKEDFYSTNAYYPKYEGRNMGPSVPEMMLIQAECLARGGEYEEAMTVVNNLRRNRFRPADFQELTAASATEALGIVLEERRRELMCHGLRWSDQRRLTDDPDFPTRIVTRIFRGVTYTLEPGAVRYTFPMGLLYLDENPEIGQIE